jgi:Trk-type K+ transport system membrane component
MYLFDFFYKTHLKTQKMLQEERGEIYFANPSRVIKTGIKLIIVVEIVATLFLLFDF